MIGEAGGVIACGQGATLTGHYTLQETERAISEKVDGLAVNLTAMSSAANIHRAASAVRNYMEQGLLREADLTWTAFVTLWVSWIWNGPDMGHASDEVGISKGTLSGVVKTLESRGLLTRVAKEGDRRSARICLTEDGEKLMERLFPVFNEQEESVMASLDQSQQQELASSLRAVIARTESLTRDRTSGSPLEGSSVS